jgi:hypothetical protein
MYFKRERKLKDRLLSFMYAVWFGGHITAHILNMRYFKLLPLDEYAGYAQEGAKNPTAEPQQEILIRVAAQGLVAVTNVPLNEFGVDLSRKEITHSDKTLIDLATGSQSKIRKENINLGNIIKSISIYDEFDGLPFWDDRYFIFQLRLLKQMVINIAEPLKACININGATAEGFSVGYRPEVIKLQQEMFGYTLRDVKREVVKSIGKAVKRLRTWNEDILWDELPSLLEAVIAGKTDMIIPRGLSLFQQQALGNFLYQAVVNLGEHVRFPEDENNQLFKRIKYFDAGFDDFLELNETDKMIRQLRVENNYRAVINNYGHVKTFRAHFLLAEAYLRLGQYKSAKEELVKFFEVTEKPITIADVLTGEEGIRTAYFYMGYVCRRFKEFQQADFWLGKCTEFSTKLGMDTASLYSNICD